MKKLITDWFTEDDGVSWCIGRAMAAAAMLTMLYKLFVIAAPDFMAFGTGVSALIAAVAAKNYSERK